VQVWQPDRQDSSVEKGGVQLQHFRGDITDKALVAEALQPRVPGQQICLVHLASIMSGQGEANFDKCLTVNLDGTRNLLEASRALLQQGQSGGAPVRFVFPSSFAAFGPALEVDDDTRLAPQSTYGMTKAMAEMLVNDFTRKGWVDGRTGRLPTVIVRPGSANGAATGCFSAVVRELLMGHDYTVPVAPRQRHPVISMRRTIKGLLALADLPSDALGHDRCVRACVRRRSSHLISSAPTTIVFCPSRCGPTANNSQNGPQTQTQTQTQLREKQGREPAGAASDAGRAALPHAADRAGAGHPPGRGLLQDRPPRACCAVPHVACCCPASVCRSLDVLSIYLSTGMCADAYSTHRHLWPNKTDDDDNRSRASWTACRASCTRRARASWACRRTRPSRRSSRGAFGRGGCCTTITTATGD